MLKKSLVSPAPPRRAGTRLFPCGVLASFRPSTLRRSFAEVGTAVGAFPFAKTHCKGERPTRSAVCTSSVLHSLQPCWGQGASLGEESVLADSGRAGEIIAGVGRVRSLACLSTLQEYSLVVSDVRTIEALACQYSFSAAFLNDISNAVSALLPPTLSQLGGSPH